MTGPGAGLSWNIASDIEQLLQYPFMVNALRAGTIVAVTAGALGWFMVLRRQAFAGHTLAIVSFPGAAGAILIEISAVVGYFAAAIAAALVIAAVPRSPGGRARISESAIVGTVQAFALACGALFVSLYGGFLSGLILVLLGCAAAEVSQITGALLVFALLVMPAATAQRVTARPMASFWLTIAVGLVVVWLALAAAYYSVYPVGFFVTTFGFAAFVIAAAARTAASRSGRVRVPAHAGLTP